MNRFRLHNNQFTKLYEEVHGVCPLCGKFLLEDKNGRTYKRAEGAHIYPHSPTKEQRELLASEPKLADNPESLDNIILLCPNCHLDFDNPRTVDDYRSLYNLKLQLLNASKGKQHYEKHNIENDLLSVLSQLGNHVINDKSPKLTYTAIRVHEKMAQTEQSLIKNVVTQNVRDYYLTVRDCLREIEKDTEGITDLISLEVKVCYLDFKKNGYSQKTIYEHLVNWLNIKTHQKYPYATPIIVAFYIQNCEVFSDDFS